MSEIKLTPVEQLIYDVMQECINQRRKDTVSAIAKKVGVSSSSVIRLAKKLGYPGWNEMYYTLDNNHTDVLSLSLNDFEFISNEYMNDYISQLCELLYQCYEGRIYVYAIGGTDFVGEHLSHKLIRRGFTVEPLARSLLRVENRQNLTSIAFVINESGIVLLDRCVAAKEQGCCIVSITSDSKSPVASYSHVAIELKNQKSSLKEYTPNFFNARAVMFIDLLFMKYDELKYKP